MLEYELGDETQATITESSGPIWFLILREIPKFSKTEFFDSTAVLKQDKHF